MHRAKIALQGPVGLSCDVQGNVIFRGTIRENISYHQPEFG